MSHTEPHNARLAALTADGDLILDDGSTVTIPGLNPIMGEPVASLHARLLSRWHGQELVIHPVRSADRWGRRPARVLGPEGDLAVILLSEGAALLDPARTPPGCAAGWRLAERRARLDRRGVWSTASAPLIDAAKPDASRIGLFTLAQGRILSVGERSRRVYLNFGPPTSGALAVSIETRLWRDLMQQGLTSQSLKGRRVLVRGIPETINGRIILDLTHAATIELDP